MAVFRLFTLHCNRVGVQHVLDLGCTACPIMSPNLMLHFGGALESFWFSAFKWFLLAFVFFSYDTPVKRKKSVKNSLIHERKAENINDQITEQLQDFPMPKQVFQQPVQVSRGWLVRRYGYFQQRGDPGTARKLQLIWLVWHNQFLSCVILIHNCHWGSYCFEWLTCRRGVSSERH